MRRSRRRTGGKEGVAGSRRGEGCREEGEQAVPRARGGVSASRPCPRPLLFPSAWRAAARNPCRSSQGPHVLQTTPCGDRVSKCGQRAQPPPVTGASSRAGHCGSRGRAPGEDRKGRRFRLCVNTPPPPPRHPGGPPASCEARPKYIPGGGFRGSLLISRQGGSAHRLHWRGRAAWGVGPQPHRGAPTHMALKSSQPGISEGQGTTEGCEQNRDCLSSWEAGLGGTGMVCSQTRDRKLRSEYGFFTMELSTHPESTAGSRALEEVGLSGRRAG